MVRICKNDCLDKPLTICNPQTGRCVLRGGAIGKRILQEREKKSEKKPSEKKLKNEESCPPLTPKQQVDHYNLFQTEFFLLFNGNSVIMTNTEQDVCARFTFKSKTVLYLDNLFKCGAFSGTKVITSVENFGRKYGYKKIELEDDARIQCEPNQFRNKGGGCSVLIAVLQILATGETWYNKMGYRSKFYTQEVAHNQKIIEMPFIKLVTGIALQSEYSKNRHFESPTLEELIDGLSLVMEGEDFSVTVREVFTNVSKLLKVKDLQCDSGHPDIEWILDILEFIVLSGHVFQKKIEEANPKNIICLRNIKIPQIKAL